MADALCACKVNHPPHRTTANVLAFPLDLLAKKHTEFYSFILSIPTVFESQL